MGAVDLPWAELEGHLVIVDGHMGHILIDPSPEVERAYQEVFRKEQDLAADLVVERDLLVVGCERRPLARRGVPRRPDRRAALQSTGRAGVGWPRRPLTASHQGAP